MKAMRYKMALLLSLLTLPAMLLVATGGPNGLVFSGFTGVRGSGVRFGG